MTEQRYVSVVIPAEDNGYEIRDTESGRYVGDVEELNRLAAEVAALRQRAEAAERERDQWRSASMAENQKRRVAESERAAQSNLKRTAYAVLDDVRTVVEKEIIPALEQGASETGPKRYSALAAALAAARKTLTDTPKTLED